MDFLRLVISRRYCPSCHGPVSRLLVPPKYDDDIPLHVVLFVVPDLWFFVALLVGIVAGFAFGEAVGILALVIGLVVIWRYETHHATFHCKACRRTFRLRELVPGRRMHPNPQIDRDASPAALRLLARAPHLER